MTYNLSEKAIAEKYEDLLFTKVMALYAAEESEKILSEIENEEPADPKNIEKIYSKTERRENFSTLWKYSKKLVTFAAMVVFVAVISLSSVVVASAEAREAVAEAIYHLMIKEYDRYTEVSIGESTGFIDPEIYDWEGAYGLTFVPDAYKFKEKKSAGTKNVIIYESNNGHFTFSQSNGNPIARVDTEDAENVETIIINESEALLVEKDGFVIITWNNQNTFFSLRGTLPADTLIFMAQGIKPLGKTETEEYEFVDPEIYDWEWAFAPTYMPDGCHFEKFQDLINQKIVSYKLNGKYIVFQQAQGEGFSYVDTENADLTKTIFIGESEAFLVVKGESSSVYWNVDGVLLKVSGMAPTEEIIKIAKSIKPIEKYEAPAEEYEFIDAEVFNWEGAYAPTYMTEEFVQTDCSIGTDIKIHIYTFEDKFIYIEQNGTTAGSHIDTENADIIKELTINNSQALYVEKGGLAYITWSFPDTLLFVCGNIDGEEIIKVAEGIRPMN
ncbi:MAG: DUF4367 domain-containing protein [Ruminococcaceae bacterium]|nr:DUF4367 domain-containing protein [Oscillospiraceae bacterium]